MELKSGIKVQGSGRAAAPAAADPAGWTVLRIVMAAGLESGAGSRPCGSDCSWAEGPTSVTKARRCDRLVMKLRSRGSPAAAAARLPLQHRIFSRC